MRFLYLIILFPWLNSSATDYYFSTSSGLDSRTSTQAQNSSTPWQTMTKANTVIGSLSPGDRLLFNRGESFDGSFSAPANGNSTNRIIIGAYGTGAAPVFNGFQSLSSWTNLGSNIWEASVNSGLNLNLVLVNGVITSQGRTPNAGSYFRVVQSTVTYPTGFLKASLAQVNAAVKSWTGAEIVVRSSEYTKDRNFVTSCTDSTINYNSQSTHSADVAAGFFFQHEVSTLDQQNEWFYNSTAHTIRMYSTSNPSGLNVKAAVYDVGINDDPVSWVEFNGVKFEGYDSIGIRFRTSTRVKIVNCFFNLMGCNAIDLDTGTGDSVLNNTFTNICNTAINEIYATFPYICNNTINSCGLWEGTGRGNNQQGDGIFCVNSVESPIINYNFIKNVGYCGITWDGRNALIRGNVVDSSGLTLADGGGIYTCCNNVGNDGSIGRRWVDSNIVTNSLGRHTDAISPFLGGMQGIYVDDNTGQVDITNNTTAFSSRNSHYYHNAYDIYVANNIIYEPNGLAFGIGLEDDGLGGAIRSMVINNNKINVNPSKSVVQLRSDANDYGSMGTFTGNSYSRSSAGSIFNTIGNVTASYSFDSWKSTFGWDQQSNFLLASDDSILLQYNPAPTSMVLPLGSTSYVNLKTQGFVGNINMLPFSGLLLVRKTLGIATLPIKFTLSGP